MATRSTPKDRPGPPDAEPVKTDGVKGERIAKRLARAGVASRREAEVMIAEGRVRLNGKLLETPAVLVNAGDRIEVDDAPIPEIERTRLWLFHKPAKVVTTNRDPQERRTIFDVLPKDLPRVITIGRLDYNTEGLILLTNDGGLARLLELPSTGWLRRYRVRVHGKVDQAALDGLKEGIAVDGVLYGAIDASLEREQGSNAWITMGLREGKNREVKNVLGALGLEVTRLIRISYGPFQLADLPEGTVREIRGRTLRDQLGERLAREAGANFDAPISAVASDKPKDKAAGTAAKKAASDKRGPKRTQKQEPRSLDAREAREMARGPRKFGGGAKTGGPARGEKARSGERAAPDGKARFGERSAGKKPAGRKGPPSRPGSGKSYVWVAPGGRPLSPKKQGAAGVEGSDTKGGDKHDASTTTGKKRSPSARKRDRTGNADRRR